MKIEASDPGQVKLAAGKPQLIEFFAFWSGPSLAMAPIIAGVENEYSSDVGFVYLDIDDPATEALRNQLHFRSEPHFILVDGNGKILKEWVGYVSIDNLRQALDAALQ